MKRILTTAVASAALLGASSGISASSWSVADANSLAATQTANTEIWEEIDLPLHHRSVTPLEAAGEVSVCEEPVA